MASTEKTEKHRGKGKIIACFVFAFLSLIGLVYSASFLIFISIKSEDQHIKYSTNGNIDYRVYLKENDFYKEPYLKSGMDYVASIIDHVDIDYKYNFKSGEKFDVDFTYRILADLKIYGESGNGIYYEDKYVLKEDDKKHSGACDKCSVEGDVTIDYDYYNKIANNFKATYGVSSKSDLTVYMEVEGQVGKYTHQIETQKLALTIPLSQKSVNIAISQDGKNEKTGEIITPSKEAPTRELYIRLCIITGTLLFISLCVLVYLFNTGKSKYDKFIHKILVDYDRLIVESKYFPNTKKMEVIKIESFSELLDVRDNIKLPIMYHEEKAHKKAELYILTGDTIYLYTVDAGKLNKDNKDK